MEEEVRYNNSIRLRTCGGECYRRQRCDAAENALAAPGGIESENREVSGKYDSRGPSAVLRTED